LQEYKTPLRFIIDADPSETVNRKVKNKKQMKGGSVRERDVQRIGGAKERENLSRINYFFKAFGVKITQNSRNSCQDYLRQFAEHATRATDKSFNNINSHNCTETKIYNGFTLRRR